MKQYGVKPKTKVKLSEWDPNATGDFKGGKIDGLKMKYPEPEEKLNAIVIE